MQYIVKNRGRKFIVDANSHKEAVKKLRDKLIESGSEEAFKKNIATEIKAGKDPKQAAAIAYSIQRENDQSPENYIIAINNLENRNSYDSLKTRISNDQDLSPRTARELLQKLENQAKLRNITDSFPKISSRQEQELRKYAQRFSYEMEEVWDGLNSRVNREGMSIDKAVEDLKETMVAQKSLYDSAINDIDGRLLPQSAKELKEELGLARKVIGSHLSKGIREYKPRQNQFNNADVAEVNEAINDAIKYLDQGFGHESYRRLELDLQRIKETMPKNTSSDEYRVLSKVLAKGTKALNAIKEHLNSKDSAIKDATAEVEITCSEPNNTHKYVQKFKIDNLTSEKYRRGNRSEAEQEIFREVITHADVLFGNTSFRILNVRDSAEKNYTYIMFGTTGEKRVDNLTKAEAEHLLKNNKLLGYDGKIVETKTLKDAKQEYRVNYHNSYTGRHAVDYVEANNVKEALRKFGKDVALRGDGTANINVHSISPNEGYQRIYGKLSELLKNKDFQDSVEDDITNQQYFTDDEIVTKNNGTLHIHELSNGKYNVHFESNWNSSYDWDKNNITWEEVIKIKNSIKDSKIKDAYYNIGGYESETDKMLRQDISKAKSMGLKTYVEKVDGSYQLTVEGPYDKVKKIVENYFAGDVSSIGDKQVFSEETMNSMQEGIEKDYESMNKRLSELHDDRLSPMTYSKLRELGYDHEDWKDLTQEQANELVAKGRKETTNRENSSEENSTAETKSTNKNTEKYKVPEEYNASKWAETEEYTEFMKEQFKTGDPEISEYGIEFKGDFSKRDLDKVRNYFDGEGLDILKTKNGIMLSQGADYVDDQEEYEEFAKQREEWLNQENKPKIEDNPENRGRWLELIKKQFDEGELSEEEQKELEELDAVINPPKTEEQKEKDKEKTKLNNELETLKSELKPNNRYFWKKSEIKEKEDRIAELERKIAELESK